MPKKVFLYLAVYVLIVAGICSCANIGSPQGGPKDETPPVLVSTEPVANSVGYSVKYRKQVIKLKFNEIISVKDASNLVVVSPPQKEIPEVSGIMDEVIVKLKDTIKPNTTYTIDFLDGAIVDNNEGNPYGPLSFAFSTDSSSIDTLCVSGYLLNAQTLNPEKGILIGAHSNLADSAFVKEPLLRITKTDENGFFCLKNLKDSVQYNIFALNDMNRDYRFDQKGEMVAFPDSALTLWAERCTYPDTIWADTIKIDTILIREKTCFYPDNIILRYYKEDYGKQYLVKSERASRDRLTLYFGYKSDTVPSLKLVNLPDTIAIDTVDWNVLEMVPTMDTLTYWLKDSALMKLDTLFVQIDYLKTDSNDCLAPQRDTLRLLAPKEKAKDGKKGKKGGDDAKAKRTGKKLPGKDTKNNKREVFEEQIKQLSDSLSMKVYASDSLRMVDSLLLVRTIYVADSTLFSDSIRARLADSIRVADSIRAAIPKMKISTTLSQSIDVYAVPSFVFDYPLAGMDSSVWHLYHKVDTVWKETDDFEIEQDPWVGRKYWFYADWEYGEQYRITIDSASVISVYGIKIEKFTQDFKVKEEKEYARMIVTVSGLLGRPAFIELLDKSEKVVRMEYVIDDVADFVDMKPGDFYMRLVLDDNDNGLWDTGNYDEKRQPETVIYNDRMFTLKANWEDNESWDINILPPEKQKPKDLKKATDKGKGRGR